MGMDKAHWPRCLLWHGWLPMISGVNGASPGAADASESAGYLVQVALGRYSSGLLAEWSLPDGFDDVEAAFRVPDAPDVWNGGLVLDRVTGVSSSAALFYAHQSEDCWGVDRDRPGGEMPACKGFCSVPGPLQSVQRAEMWGVILAFSVFWCCTLGVDNLGVVRHVGRLLDSHYGSVLFELVNDGDLLLLLKRVLRLRSRADEGMVLDGRVRKIDRLGKTPQMRLLTLVVGELVMLSLMLVVIYLGFVVAGALSFLTLIGFSLPFLGLWSIMMVGMVLLPILWFGLLVPSARRPCSLD